ncbi:MAG TPA: FGGY-family carbohydrate kinase [Thermomicrobiales bacterium]|nr:FGGY-family carbohydrate kinase [Thermomicrobiales bacterium]
MPGSLLLGVDIGTSSSKGVLCTPEGDVLASHAIEHETSFPRPGWAEHDADAIWWGEFVRICRVLLSGKYSGDDVGGVAVSAIGPCMLPVDAGDRPLRPGILYGIDSRAQEEIAWLESRYGADAMFDLNGMALTSQAVGPKIRWLREHEPELFAKTARIHSASDYLVLRLTGEHVIDRHSASYFVPLFDVRKLDWDDRFADEVIGIDRLPHLLDADEIAGTVSARAAAGTGLAIGTPVTTGTIDAAAEAISVGVTAPGDMMVIYGSTLFLIDLVAEPHPDRRMWTAAYCLPGVHAVTGSITSSGLLTKWFRDQLGGAERAGGANAYQALAALAAATPPGADGLICLPYFAGERTPLNDPDARGVFAGLTLRHTRGHLYRAVLEAIGYGLRTNLEVMAEMNAAPKRLVAVGGGTQSDVWTQIVSDVTGMAQILPEKTVGASYGDALLAGLATGIVDRATGIDTWVRTKRVVAPNAANTAIHDRGYDIYRNLYLHARDDLHALAQLDTAFDRPA